MPDTGASLGTATLILETDDGRYEGGLKKAKHEAQDLGEETKKAGDKAEKAFDAPTKAAGGFGSKIGEVGKIASGFVIGGGILKAPGFFMDAAKGAAEDEAATRRLELALHNLGGNYDENLAKVNDAIDSGQKLAFSDDDVRDSFQMLAAATGDTDEALKRQKAAMDLARGANIPLATATKMLGKLSEENIQVFKKLGITIADGASEAEVLAVVQGKFGGQAEGFANSTAGQFEILKIRLAEAQETIGGAVLPVMAAVGDVLATKVMPAIELIATKATPIFQTLGSVLGVAFGFLVDHSDVTIAALMGIAAAIITALIPATIAWIAAEYAKVTALLASAAAFIVANAPLILIAAGIALLVTGIVLLVKHWDEITKKVPALGVAFDAVKAAIAVVVGWITGTLVPALKTIADAVIAFVDKAVGYVKSHWDEISKVIEVVFKVVSTVVETYFKLIVNYFETYFKIFMGLLDVFIGLFTGDWDKVWKGVKEVFTAVWDGISNALEITYSALNKLTAGKLGELKDKVTGIFGDIKSWLTDNVWGFISDTVPGWFGTAGEKITGFVSGIGDGIANGFKSGINAIVDGINAFVRAVNGIHIDVPGFSIPFAPDFPGFHWGGMRLGEVPHLAAGGIAMSPTLAVIGDNPAGEAVIPLDQLQSGVTVNVYNPRITATDQQDAARSMSDIGWAVMAFQRRRGYA